jgi:hypothetical protein
MRSNGMNQEELQKALEALGKSGITVNGDLVLEKHVENEIGNVEAGGIGIQINNGKDSSLSVSDKDIKTAIEELQAIQDDNDEYLMHDLDQWYAVFRVLSQFCGYPKKPKDFELTMKNIGADGFRLPCKYDNFRKVTLNKLPQNVALWKQYVNSADQYSLKQIKVAIKLMDLLYIE